MNQEKSILDRRSTRLSMAIPVNVSGVDAGGQPYSESVRTVVINKHGGKIATTRQLAMGAEVVIENHAVGLVAKAGVVWLGEERPAGELRHVGLQLLDAQNIWGIAFPPDDWVAEQGEEVRLKPRTASPPVNTIITGSEPNRASASDVETSVRALHELQETANTCFRDFQNRLKQLNQRLGLEVESVLHQRGSKATDPEANAMEELIRNLRESLQATKDEVGKLEALVQSLKPEAQLKR